VQRVLSSFEGGIGIITCAIFRTSVDWELEEFQRFFHIKIEIKEGF
jgi:hypothetical protein